MEPQRCAELEREIRQIAREIETCLHSPCVEFDQVAVDKLREAQHELDAVLRWDRPDSGAA